MRIRDRTCGALLTTKVTKLWGPAVQSPSSTNPGLSLQILLKVNPELVLIGL